ncbi:MAG: threonine ammonia-lyase [Streptosporangiales bacterium]|nr:threonine ammonia-lyase [Streptosporangiales bacterium]
MAEGGDSVVLDSVTRARELLRDVVLDTPLVSSPPLARLAGGPVHFKCENLQRAGSFKVRGAYVRIAGLSAAERARGVVAASAGNHAQGVALGAKLLGSRATVFMPEGAPLPKVAATRSYGAEVVFAGPTVDSALTEARRYADEHDAVFIHPFDHPDVIAGQGTIGLEILEQCPDVATVVTPVGGGGLAAGMALAVKAKAPHVKVVGVQAEGAAAFPPSLAVGEPVRIRQQSTMADGIAVGMPGELTYRLVAELLDGVITVSEESLSQALLFALERAKMLVEPAGGAGLAALLDQPHHFEPPVVVLLSGGNIDPLLLAKVLRHGLAAAGRYLAFRCRLPDRPGTLVALLADLADLGANVLDVVHERAAARLDLGEAEVFLQVETRGPEHCDEVLGHLRLRGYALTFT